MTVTPTECVALRRSGSTRRLSAAATDASGRTCRSPGFTWKSLNTAVATVSSSGLVTAKAAGTTRVVVTASCCGADTATVTVSSGSPPPPLKGLLFQDGFESGDQSHRENGVRWSGSGSNVNVVSKIAHSGSHSLEFVFRGKPSGQDAVAQQRFNLGRNLKEIWVEFYIYYPDGTEGLGARYRHRDDTGSNNNKFLRIWGDEYSASNEVGASTWPLAGGDSGSASSTRRTRSPWGTMAPAAPVPS